MNFADNNMLRIKVAFGSLFILGLSPQTLKVFGNMVYVVVSITHEKGQPIKLPSINHVTVIGASACPVNVILTKLSGK